MIRHECPSKAFCGAFRQNIGKAGNKAFLVGVIDKDVVAFDPANNDVLQNVRDVKAWLAWHKRKLIFLQGQGNSGLASNVPLPARPMKSAIAARLRKIERLPSRLLAQAFEAIN